MVSNQTNMSIFSPFEVVCRGIQTQLQVGEKKDHRNHLTLSGIARNPSPIETVCCVGLRLFFSFPACTNTSTFCFANGETVLRSLQIKEVGN